MIQKDDEDSFYIESTDEPEGNDDGESRMFDSLKLQKRQLTIPPSFFQT